MRRWIFNAAAGLSLVLCLGTVGLWVDSYRYTTHVLYAWSPWVAGIQSQDGKVTLGAIACEVPFSQGWSCNRDVPKPEISFTLDTYVWHSGDDWANTVQGSGRILRSHQIAARHLSLAVVFSILPLVWAGRERIPPGHCEKCGYDLRASEERCPECGTAIPIPDAAEARQ